MPQDLVSLAVWIALSSIAGVAVAVLCFSMHIRSWQVWIIGVLAVVGSWSSLWIRSVTLTPVPCHVTVTSPSTGAILQSKNVEVNGNVKPASAIVTIAVRAESDTHWWIQDVVQPDPISGKWNIAVTLGTDTAGKGQAFELIALASTESVLSNALAGRYLYKGLRITDLPVWNRSSLILVTRAN